MSENEVVAMELHGKPIDEPSLQVDGIHVDDYPKFCDAYFWSGRYADGTELSNEELDELGTIYAEELHEMAHEKLRG